MSSPVEQLFELAGGPSGLQKAFRLKTLWAASKWLKQKKLPPYRIIPACELVGFAVTPHQIDPVLYPHLSDGIPPKSISNEADDGR